MLTNSENVVRYNYTDKSVDTLNFDFGFWDKSNIKVKATTNTGELVDLISNDDFEVSEPSEDGGTITKLSNWDNYDKITIIREVAEKQELDLVNGQPIDATSLERALDILTAICQQIAEKQGRSFYLRIDELGGDFQFPSKEERKNSLLGFGNTGSEFIVRNLQQFDSDVLNTANNAQQAFNQARIASNQAIFASQCANEASISETNAQRYAQEVQSYLPVAKTITILTSDWVNKVATISVEEVFASSKVLVAPIPNDIDKYSENGIYCDGNADGTITFICSVMPSTNISVNLMIWG